ncbi:ubiquitin conjugating enzyme E2 B [Pelagophyceae sp. CCMP2097]|nr:ubiquitin conjugating enzyme E2 B [Pelagophyceae sp. CCMP2097]|mmetsp:Transcript_19623/g.66332  ORF Transcript_19623/g.66332 Transcript_19623/m.66332 type:complete len:150 (+) Transcript_19623:53-502(+)|eukprot:CAMPEP_0184110864 /NCGR_PEP_ID=MMETSP0974-20121125/17620_1 /TAXON_ID=483370 /ORGANISM="non described non described, Strain CCMP2097" /LENGTH=149 /DNA_ID=CAMNT_0026413941 /DNA_START=33 /DNA_END=482 /DNA_ORIENTATION=+
MASIKRLQKELTEFEKNPLEDVSVGIDGDNLLKWQAMLTGPPGTPYAGGCFSIDVDIPAEYPFKAPKLKFMTKIYHPNVNKETGEICNDALAANWGPTLNIRHLLSTIRTLLLEPNGDHPLEAEIAKQFSDDRKLFDATAKAWTQKEAM